MRIKLVKPEPDGSIVVADNIAPNSYVSEHRVALLTLGVSMVVIGAALGYASNHPKWLAFKMRRRMANPPAPIIEAEVTELGRS
jgi:hypothetical protein